MSGKTRLEINLILPKKIKIKKNQEVPMDAHCRDIADTSGFNLGHRAPLQIRKYPQYLDDLIAGDHLEKIELIRGVLPGLSVWLCFSQMCVTRKEKKHRL